MASAFLAAVAVAGLAAGRFVPALSALVVARRSDRPSLPVAPSEPPPPSGIGRRASRSRSLPVAVLQAVLWGLAAWRFGPSWQLVPYLLFFSVLLILSVIDLDTYRLPDALTLPSIAASLLLLPVTALIQGTYVEHGHRFTPIHATTAALIGGITYFGFLFVPAWISPRGMGFGDVKLAGLMGLYLGWVSPTLVPVLVILSLVIASVIGLVVGLGVLVARGGKSRPYPFGPWLALGCVIAIVGSDPLLGLYAF